MEETGKRPVMDECMILPLNENMSDACSSEQQLSTGYYHDRNEDVTGKSNEA